jgi:hypothetical protein
MWDRSGSWGWGEGGGGGGAEKCCALEGVDGVLGDLKRECAGKWFHEVMAEAGGASRLAEESEAPQKRGRRW